MVYEDEVHIVSGFPGLRVQPCVQFQRRALSLPANASYSNLTALLTVAGSAWELERFPYLQGLGGNGTGNDRRFELTPITAVSVHLLGSSGRELQVSQPVSISVPLPPDSGLKENDHVPAWRFDPKLGVWLKSSLGYVQKEGGQLTLSYSALQLGYWVVAMSPLNTGAVVAKDISTYHTAFLLAILGGMALILLFLLCLLLYYCRRKCLKPRQHHRKLQLSSALDGSKRDQATSMSHLNLISEVHLELASATGEPDLHTPMLKPSPPSRHHHHLHEGARDKGGASLNNLTSRASLLKDYHKSVETFPLQEPPGAYEPPAPDGYRRSYSSTSSQQPPAQASALQLCAASESSVREAALPQPAAATPDRGPPADRRPADYSLSRSVDHLERPTSFPRPGQLLCCSSVDQMTEGAYRKVRPTLVIPAHYMKLPGEHPYAGQALLLQTDQQSDLDTIQAELSASHRPQGPQGQEPLRPGLGSRHPSGHALQDPQDGEWTLQTASVPESLSIPTSLSEAGLVQMNGEDQLLAEKTLMELRGGRPLPHPRAWFVSLDGRSNAHIRHSYIDLQRAGHSGSNDASLDSGVDMNEPKLGRRPRERERERERERKAPPAVAYTQLVYVDDAGPDGSQNGTPDCSPEDNALGPLLQEAPGPEEAEEAPSPSPLRDVEVEVEVEGEGEEEDAKDVVFRTERALPQVHLPSSPPDDVHGHDDSGEDENKKSPWQKREERPLLAFNLK
ncbi:protein FAM171A1 isoform X2 [Anguilla rostrata]